jgi:tetratricopeptide (TPR) repeat protein
MSTRQKRKHEPPHHDPVKSRIANAPAENARHGSAPEIALPKERQLALLVSIALIVGNVFVFAGIWRQEFISFDDPQYVTENVHVKAGLTWGGVQWAFATGEAANWHPLAWISHMLDVALFGVQAGPHHVTNLILHIVNSLLLFGVLWRMTGTLYKSAFVAALFAVHPLHVESVAWVSERKDVLSTFFWFLGLWAYAAYVRDETRLQYALVFLCLALGLMSKPMVVTFPFALLLLDYWPLRRPVSRRLIFEKIPFFALVAASSVVTFLAQRHGGAVSSLAALPLPSRVANAGLAYVAYIEKTVWPSGLTVLYPYTREFGWRLAVAVLVVVVLSAFAIFAARAVPYVAVGWFWFLGTLVPVIGIVQVGIQSMADRYTYVPAIGLFVIVAWGVPDLLRALPASRVAALTAAMVAISGCMIVARAQVRYWRDSLTLWEHAASITPGDAHVETALGSVLSEQGRAAEAKALFVDALRREPQFAEAHNKLGVALADEGLAAEAIPHYEAAIAIKPSLAEAHYNLANAFAALGKPEDAIAHYHAALRIRPEDAATHNGLGSALDDRGRIEEAIAEYEQSIRLDPQFADAHNNLGTARAKQGKTDEAIREFFEALKIKPNADAHYNVAVMLNEKGRTDEAIQHLRDALRLKPDYDRARQALQVLGARITP